jgi:cyclomaltodextrinase / maltogenic alpha-amylase / neopullulanase
MTVKLKNIFQHHKGNFYRLLNVSRHSESLEEFIVYEALYKNDLGQTWVRPKDMFFGYVLKEGKPINRFGTSKLYRNPKRSDP